MAGNPTVSLGNLPADSRGGSNLYNAIKQTNEKDSAIEVKSKFPPCQWESHWPLVKSIFFADRRGNAQDQELSRFGKIA